VFEQLSHRLNVLRIADREREVGRTLARLRYSQKAARRVRPLLTAGLSRMR